MSRGSAVSSPGLMSGLVRSTVSAALSSWIDRSQQQRALAFEPQLEPRQVAGILEEQAFGTIGHGAAVAMGVEHGKGVAGLQRSQGALNQRGLSLDVVLGQLVWSRFRTARGRSHGVFAHANVLAVDALSKFETDWLSSALVDTMLDAARPLIPRQ